MTSMYSDQALQSELANIRRNAAIHEMPRSMIAQEEANARVVWEAARREELSTLSNQPVPAGVPPRYAEAVRQARAAFAEAQKVFDDARAGAIERMKADRPSEDLARLWLEDATLRPLRNLETQQQILTDRTTELGNAIATVQQLAAVEAADPGRRDQAKRAYDTAIAAADRDLRQARAAVAGLT